MVQSFPKGSTSERRIGTMPSVQEPSGEHLIFSITAQHLPKTAFHKQKCETSGLISKSIKVSDNTKP